MLDRREKKDEILVVIRDSRVVAKKTHQCHHCKRQINDGANYRRIILKDGFQFHALAIHDGCARKIRDSISAYDSIYKAYLDFPEKNQFTNPMNGDIDVYEETETSNKKTGVLARCMQGLIAMALNFLRIKKV